MVTKRCFKCLCELPLEAFYKHAMMGDGHLNKCKDCTKKDTKANRLAKKLNALELARMVGHKDLKMLLRYYNESAEEIAKRLE